MYNSIWANITMFNAARIVVLVNKIFLHIFTETRIAMCMDFSVTLVGSVDSSLGI